MWGYGGSLTSHNETDKRYYISRMYKKKKKGLQKAILKKLCAGDLLNSCAFTKKLINLYSSTLKMMWEFEVGGFSTISSLMVSVLGYQIFVS